MKKDAPVLLALLQGKQAQLGPLALLLAQPAKLALPGLLALPLEQLVILALLV